MAEAQAGSSGWQSSPQFTADDDFVALANALQNVVCAVTVDGRVHFVNRAARHSLGLSDAALPVALTDLLTEDSALASQLVSAAIAEGVEQDAQLRFRSHRTEAEI